MESKTRTSRRKVLEVGGKSSALALAFLATLRSAGGVGAERPPANGDSHQRQCRSIYDLVQALLAEYKRVGLANPNSSRLDEILAELRNLGSDWNAIGCKARYGSVVAYEQPNGHWGNLDDIVTNIGDWVTATEEPSGAIVTPASDELGSGDAPSHHKGKRKKGKKGKRRRR